MNEQLLNAVESLQAQNGALQNPLAEATLIEREGKLVIAQDKHNLDVAKFTDKQEQWRAELAEKTTKDASDTAIRVTELEVDSGQQLDSELQSNANIFANTPTADLIRIINGEI